MNETGLQAGAFGDQVSLLHQQLIKAGYEIATGEAGRQFFGPGTRAAIMRYQQCQGLPVTGRADPATLAALAASAQTSTADVTGAETISTSPAYPTGQPAPTPQGSAGPLAYVVQGHVTWSDGAPAAGVLVRAADQDLRTEQPLGQDMTDVAGGYSIRYTTAQFARAEDDSADLIVRALDANDLVFASSPTFFNAPAQTTVDLVISGAVAGQPSEYERVVARIAPLLADVKPPDVSQLEPSDLGFLIGETGMDQTRLNSLLSAAGLSREAADVPVAAFYGLIRQGLPTTWAGLLTRSAPTIAASIVAAATGGVAPVSLRDRAESIANEICAAAAKQALSSPTGEATGLGDLLTAAGLATGQQQSLLGAIAAKTGTPQEFWQQLTTQPGFDSPGVVPRLQLTAQLTLLTGNHAPLIKAVLADTAITSTADLVSLDTAAWKALLDKTVDGKPVGPPPGVSAETYVQGITATVQAVFPNQTVASLVTSNPGWIANAGVRQVVSQILVDGAAGFDIRSTRITDYSRANATAFGDLTGESLTAAVSQLQRLQRAFQISVSAETMSTLLGLGFDAAHLVADTPRQAFLDTYATQLGGQVTAVAIHDRATFLNTRNMMLISQASDLMTGLYPLTIGGGQVGNGSSNPQADVIKQYPDLAGLFGAFDYCTCEDCTSVLSPAAYLVDILEFLNHKPNSAGHTPRDVLLSRRPDLAYIPLTCENTNTVLPYIDLVNEVLEAYLLYGDTPTQWAAHDTGDLTTPQLDAGPAFTLDAGAYDITQGAPEPLAPPAADPQTSGPYFTLSRACFPFSLPFNQPIAVARTHLGFMGTSRYAVLTAAQLNPDAVSAALDAEYLRLDPYLYQLLTASDLSGNAAAVPAVGALYGYANQPPSLEVWIASVPMFMQQTGVTLGELSELLVTSYINPFYPTGADRTMFAALPLSYAELTQLAATGFTNPSVEVQNALANAGIKLTDVAAWWARNPDIGQLLVISTPTGCNVSQANLAHLQDQSPPADPELTRLHTFIRMWRVLGWSISDVDRALVALAAPEMTDVIHGLARIRQLSDALSPASLQVLFALWSQINADGTDALYTQLFLNPALVPLDPAFAPVNGAVLTGTANISDHIPALIGALQVSASDLALIRADAGLSDPQSGTPAPLNLVNVSVLYRYAALAQLLGMQVSDLITLKMLSEPGSAPFTSPDTTLAFVELARSVQASQFSVAQLGYLYAGTSNPPTGLAPQQTTLVVMAAALRSGLTQIATQTTPAPDPKGTFTHNVIAQLVSATVADQIVAMISGTATYSAPLSTPLPTEIARTGVGGTIIGVDPQQVPALVGAKLSYDSATSTLRYTGGMTDAEQQALTAQLGALGDAGDIVAAVTSLYQQPTSFLTDNLGGLLTDPAAADILLHVTPSVDGQLNPVQVDANDAQVPPSPGPVAITSAGWKFAYLLDQLLPALASLLSHTLVKQMVADAFSLNGALSSALLEQILTSPATPGQMVIADLLALSQPGVTATFYANATASGTPSSVTTATAVAIDGTTVTLPAGTASATFTSWLTVPNSATFTFTVQTNGTPQLFMNDTETPVALTQQAAGQPWTGSVPLAAGTMIWVSLTITQLPAAPEQGTAILTWQAQTVPRAPIPAAAQLPAALMDSFTSAYRRIQKAAMVAQGFSLSVEELSYLQTAGTGAQQLFSQFDLNALPLALDASATDAQARFSSWPRVNAFALLRSGLPAGAVTLIDVFTAATLGQAQSLLAQVTGWDAAAIEGVLTQFLPPGSTPASQNPLADDTVLIPAQVVFGLMQLTGASPAQLFSWAAIATTDLAGYDILHATAQDIKNTTASHYDPVTWLTVAEPLSDRIRGSQRDALAAYAMARLGFTDSGDLFELLLIDVEMGACMGTSRIRQAVNSAQLFVQRCLLNLEAEVSPGQIDAGQWNTWRSQYSIWAAAREVFLFPEEYMIEQLRDDQTPIFSEFSNALLQNDITSDSAAEAFLDYLEELKTIARLDICGMYHEQETDPNTGAGIDIIHVVARTWHTPPTYYYRTLTNGQAWSAWEPIQADITDDHVIPVFWQGRLRLIWPVFTTQTYSPPVTPPVTVDPTTGQQTPVTGQAPQNYWQITLAWSEYSQGKWKPKSVTDEFLLSFAQVQGNASAPEIIQPDKSVHIFKGRLDGDDLVIDCYVEEYLGNQTPTLDTLLGRFCFSAGGDSVSVAYAHQESYTWTWPSGITESPHTEPQFLSRSYQYLQPNTTPYNNGLLQNSGPPTQFVGAWGFDWTQPLDFWLPVQATQTEYLGTTPTQYELRYPQQDYQFCLQGPFFYQDKQRTFYVTRVPGYPLSDQLANGETIGPERLLAAGEKPANNSRRTKAAHASGPYPGGNWPVPTQTAPPPEPYPSDVILLTFYTHRHPYVTSLIRQLTSGQDSTQSAGVDGLLTITNQELMPGAVFPPFDFYSQYSPNLTYVGHDLPCENIDFSPTGPYSVYNWELFFHAPLLIATTLSQNQRFADADKWFRYIFDPTSRDALTYGSAGYWQVLPLRDQVPQTLLDLMNAIDTGDADAVSQVTAWANNPFDPFVIARSRYTAFMKNVFICYIRNQIGWADQLYGQVDTIESINLATQLYVGVAQMLGELPEQIPPPYKQPELCYAQLAAGPVDQIDAFGNISELLENEFPYAGGVPALNPRTSQALCGFSKTLLFCIPQDSQLLQFWTTVQSRLNNIRQCLNIAGAPQTLPLFEPPANPLLLVEAAAEGIDPGSVLSDLSAPLPNYRFSYLMAKASEYAADSRAFGRLLLDALEKNDAEGLALLRATQEAAILTMMHDVKQTQIDEAQDALAALTISRQTAVGRYNYYQMLLGAAAATIPAAGSTIAPVAIPGVPMQSTGGTQSSGTSQQPGVQLNAQEQSELNLAQQAEQQRIQAQGASASGSAAALFPNLSINLAAEPVGVGALTGLSFGGSNLAAAAEAVAKGFELQASVLTYKSYLAGKMGGYQRRQQDWAMQSNLASGEIMRVDQDIAAATDRITIAQDELKINEQQTANAQKVHDYLTGKYTNQELYSWMITQASNLHSQLYQLAYSTAKLAERAYQRELAVPESSYITFGYWDSLRKGLLAGERLQIGLRQLERAYIDQNEREYEISRYVPLLLHDPGALIALKVTGECVVDLPEELFDLDYPGHYLRRLRDVSLTIPCVAGPYTSVNCTLTLLSSKIRFDPGTAGPAPGGGGGGAGSTDNYQELAGSHDPRFLYYFAATQSIATSHAQNDSGIFEVNFRDERYLPFETAGAISRWMISMPSATNAFDRNTITNVVIRLSYTARDGGELLRTQALQAATLPPAPQQTAAAVLATPSQTDRTRLFSLKHEFPSEWYAMLHPADPSAQYGQMPLQLQQDRFPYQYRGNTIHTGEIELYAILGPADGPAGSAAQLADFDAYLTAQTLPPGGGQPPLPNINTATDQVTLNSQPAMFGQSAPVLYGYLQPQQTMPVPYTWWLSIPFASLAAIGQQVSDIYAVFHYSAVAA
jgi:peptidoglycan hydrolase-like protein with peptidoglycan-binding domain